MDIIKISEVLETVSNVQSHLSEPFGTDIVGLFTHLTDELPP